MVKRHMEMLPNGNYEQVISPIQHKCVEPEYRGFYCVEYGWDMGKLHLKLDYGDPYEDGCSHEIEVKYCPFCGYKPLTDNKD